MENTIKGALDAMQSVVYRDDAQVIGYRSCFKIYGEQPRLEILVEPLNGQRLRSSEGVGSKIWPNRPSKRPMAFVLLPLPFQVLFVASPQRF